MCRQRWRGPGRRSATATRSDPHSASDRRRAAGRRRPLFPGDHAPRLAAAISGRRDSAEVVRPWGPVPAVRARLRPRSGRVRVPGIPVQRRRLTTTPVDVDGGTTPTSRTSPVIRSPPSPIRRGWPGMAWNRHLLIVDSADLHPSEMFFVTPAGLSPTRWERRAVPDRPGRTLPEPGTATASGTSFAGHGPLRRSGPGPTRSRSSVGPDHPPERSAGRHPHRRALRAPRAPEWAVGLRLPTRRGPVSVGSQARPSPERCGTTAQWWSTRTTTASRLCGRTRRRAVGRRRPRHAPHLDGQPTSRVVDADPMRADPGASRTGSAESIRAGCGRPQCWFSWPPKISLTDVSSNTASMASAMIPAGEDLDLVGASRVGAGCWSAGTFQGRFFNRSMAGPENTPWVAAQYTDDARAPPAARRP